MISRSDVPAAADSAPRFVLLGELASGGMGSVDLVRMIDGSGERIAAMKRMHPQFSRDAEFVQMFRDEIWLTRLLHHENVVELLGWGEDDEGPYLVMEFVDGAPLAEIVYQLRRVGKTLPEEIAVYVAARVAEGLHAAHTLTDEHGRPLALVHRDVTPSNVLVGFDGAIKITDFGIAKAAASSSHTRTGVVKGKLEYMSPEQALRRAVDGRADLYSLGAVLFEIFSGEPPVSGGSDLELLKRIVYEPAVSLAARAPELDRELSAIVDRMLSKTADQRPGDGAEVARRCDDWLATRGLVGSALRTRLAELAARHGAARRRRLRKLLEAPGTELGSSSSWRDPKRVRAPSLPGVGTFLAAPAATRAVLAAPIPAVSVPSASAPAPAPAPPPAPAPTRRLSFPPPANALPAEVERSPWLPVLAGIAVALALVLAIVSLTLRSARSAASTSTPSAARSSERSERASEASRGGGGTEPPVRSSAQTERTIESPAAELAAPARAQTQTPTPIAPAPSAPSAASIPSAGHKRPTPAKVQSTLPTRSKPCTPDRFDYPACLSGR